MSYQWLNVLYCRKNIFFSCVKKYLRSTMENTDKLLIRLNLLNIHRDIEISPEKLLANLLFRWTHPLKLQF